MYHPNPFEFLIAYVLIGLIIISTGATILCVLKYIREYLGDDTRARRRRMAHAIGAVTRSRAKLDGMSFM